MNSQEAFSGNGSGHGVAATNGSPNGHHDSQGEPRQERSEQPGEEREEHEEREEAPA